MFASLMASMKTSSDAARKRADSGDGPMAGKLSGDVRSRRAMEPKLPCRVTVTESGWEGARKAAIACGCSSVSDMLEKLARGELSIIESDAISLDPIARANRTLQPGGRSGASHEASRGINARAIAARLVPPGVPKDFSQNVLQHVPQHIHIHTASEIAEALEEEEMLTPLGISLPKLIVTSVCAAGIIGCLLYVADQILTNTSDLLGRREQVEDIVTPKTGDTVAGFRVSDEYGIRPFHPVTGAPNAPHNGVDLATPVGTPIYAVGKAGDPVTVECWWDDGGGGWVVDQTAESYPGYTFQSLHTSKNGCQEGIAMAGEAIAYSGNSGLGTGEHYDFRVKIDGEYMPPATKYLESAMTGEPPTE